MKSLRLFVLILLLFGISAAQQPNDPATKEDVQKLFETMRIRSQVDGMMSMMRQQSAALSKSMLDKKFPALTPEQKAEVLKHSDEVYQKLMASMPFDEMMKAMMPAYQHQLTHEDVTELLRFYSSPVGQKVLDKMPAMTTEAMQAAMPVMEKWLSEQFPTLDKETEAYAKSMTKQGAGKNEHR